jgi:hypothetical protein
MEILNRLKKNSLKMAIIDVLKYGRPNNVLVWKWRSDSNSFEKKCCYKANN